MDDLFMYLTMGASFGLMAGISPGPLLTLVLSESLTKNYRAGIKVALAPLITDFPIILVILLILRAAYSYDILIKVISIIGSLYLFYLAYQNLVTSGLPEKKSGKLNNALIKGIVANLLNPHPYLFWILVGGPIILESYTTSPIYTIAFLTGLYFFLLSSKILLAILTGKSKRFIRPRIYTLVNQALGLVLIFFGFYFIFDLF